MPRLDASAMTQPLGGSTHGDTIRYVAFYSPCLFVKTTTERLESLQTQRDRLAHPGIQTLAPLLRRRDRRVLEDRPQRLPLPCQFLQARELLLQRLQLLP